MHKHVLLLLGIICVTKSISAQCILLPDCPPGPVTVCDSSTNDVHFWNEPYWYDTATGTHDLSEAGVPLSIRIVDTCSAGNLQVSFVLLLDLNGDGVQETAVASDHLPPADTIYYGNANNPNYTGGTPYHFDERPVPKAVKFAFALQTTTTGDTLVAQIGWNNASQPLAYLNPYLPAGHHRIKWYVRQGNTLDSCTYDFTIADCTAPQVQCLSGLVIDISSIMSVFNMYNFDFLQYAQDNYTPAIQLRYAIRRSGTGTGFPVDTLGNPIIEITYSCADVGTQSVELWVKDLAGNTGYCETQLLVRNSDVSCSNEPISIVACVESYCSQGIEEVNFELNTIDPVVAIPFDINGGCLYANGNFLANNVQIQVTPIKDDNPLNGVSTYDLVLISRHILGLDTLDSPYKLIAADANRSNSITTSDIVELRRLIMGIYQELPNNTSWRFVNKYFVFPNPNNPFQTLFPESDIVSLSTIQNPHPQFVAIKVGDVNCNAQGNVHAPIQARQQATLFLPDMSLEAGATVDITLRPAEATAWLGWQGSLHFDSQHIDIQSVTSNTLPGWSTENWSLLPGQINISWSAAQAVRLLPDEALITLRIRARTALALHDALYLETAAAASFAALQPEAYPADGNPVDISLRFTSPVMASVENLVFAPHPNPTNGGFQIPLQLNQPQTVTVTLSDLTGRRLYQRTVDDIMGKQLLDVPGDAFPQSGLYVWRVQVGDVVQVGKIVRD